MSATILKGPKAAQVSIAIIGTFAMVRQLKRELRILHGEADDKKRQSEIRHFGEMLSNTVMTDSETTGTGSGLGQRRTDRDEKLRDAPQTT